MLNVSVGCVAHQAPDIDRSIWYLRRRSALEGGRRFFSPLLPQPLRSATTTTTTATKMANEDPRFIFLVSMKFAYRVLL